MTSCNYYLKKKKNYQGNFIKQLAQCFAGHRSHYWSQPQALDNSCKVKVPDSVTGRSEGPRLRDHFRAELFFARHWGEVN